MAGLAAYIRGLLIGSLLVPVLLSGQSIEGLWIGDVKHAGHSTPLLFMLSAPGAEQKMSGRVFSAERNTSHDLAGLSNDVGTLQWEIRRVGVKFTGKLATDGKSIDGVWTDMDGSQPLRLVRYERTSFALSLGADIDAFVPTPPTAVRADGRFHLMYEVHVTNWGSSEALIERLDMLVDGKEVRLDRKVLDALFLTKSSRLGPGARSAVILMLSSSTRPTVVEHRLTVKRPDEPAATVTCAKATVLHDIVRFSPPVRGSEWVMHEGPDVPSHHRTGLLAVNGRVRGPQRFAFDLHKAGDTAAAEKAGIPKNSEFPSYGEEVIAVADATVTAVRDGIPDNVPDGLTSAVPITAETMLGNHVVLDVGSGRHVVYAHLQPGLPVRQGQRVERGAVLGRIGNSGRSTAPHLHFHVADGPTLDAEGLPFVFETFERDGVRHSDEMPLHGWRVNFSR